MAGLVPRPRRTFGGTLEGVYEYVDPTTDWYPLTECQVFLTRRCQLRCMGCQVVRKDVSELDEAGWVDVAGHLARLGIKTVKILGGEPTLHPALVAFVGNLSGRGIKTALLTNGLGLVLEDGSYNPIYDAVADAGLYAVFPSIDGKRSPFAAKTQPGWSVIEWARSRNISLLGANVAVSPLGLAELPEVVAELVEHGVRVNLSAYNYLRPERGEAQADFDFRMQVPKGLQYPANGLFAFVATIEKLRPHAHAIAGGNEYLDAVATYGFSGSWECDSSNQLRLDSNGKVMLCLDRQLLTPVDLADIPDWERYHRMWQRAREAIGTCSCAWSSPMLAAQRVRNNQVDMGPRA